MPKVTIDGHTIEVPDGTTILEAARKIGGKIVPPAMCYYSTLENKWWLLPYLHRKSLQRIGDKILVRCLNLSLPAAQRLWTEWKWKISHLLNSWKHEQVLWNFY